jgi:hypothetical protein
MSRYGTIKGKKSSATVQGRNRGQKRNMRKKKKEERSHTNTLEKDIGYLNVGPEPARCSLLAVPRRKFYLFNKDAFLTCRQLTISNNMIEIYTANKKVCRQELDNWPDNSFF